MTSTISWPDLRSDLEQAARRFAAMAASADGDQPVTGTDWTVHDTVAHVTTVLDRWIGTARGGKVDIARGREFRGRMAEINRREIDAAPATHDHLVAAALRWLDTVPDPTATLHAFGTPDARCTFAEASGLLLGEILVHGYDVAQALHQPWAITGREATAIFDGILPILPLLYEGSATGGKTFDIDVRLRGRGRGVGLHCEPDALTISDGSPSRASVHISADPVAWLLVGYGRRSQMAAALTGKVVAWGRKPWLAAKFGELVQPA
jgi:uncharacterized protein (TIGR03083 family)